MRGVIFLVAIGLTSWIASTAYLDIRQTARFIGDLKAAVVEKAEACR